jgi:hypothetical protein
MKRPAMQIRTEVGRPTCVQHPLHVPFGIDWYAAITA